MNVLEERGARLKSTSAWLVVVVFFIFTSFFFPLSLIFAFSILWFKSLT